MSLVPTRPSSLDIISPSADLADKIARTEFVPGALRNRPDAVLACILYGHEMGIGPMEALGKIHVIDGRPAPNAELMRALVLRAGHRVWVEESTNTRAVVCGQRAGSGDAFRVAWTMEDARKAGLAGKPNYQRYPRQMLIARAFSELCRLMAPDALGSAEYSSEELADGDGAAPSLDVAPTAAPDGSDGPTRRRRPPRTPSAPVAPAAIDAEARIGPQDAPGATNEGGPLPTRPPLPSEPLRAAESEDVAPVTPADPGEAPEPWRDRARADALITDAQKRKMHALFNVAGLTERIERLAFASGMTARKIDTSNELSVAEASSVIDALSAVEAGNAAITLDEFGMPVGITWAEDE